MIAKLYRSVVILLATLLIIVPFGITHAVSPDHQSLAVEAGRSGFAGPWEATDIDGSHLRLMITGRAANLRLIWLDDYWSICDGGPGIGLGTGSVDSSDPNVFHAEVSFYCGATLWDTLTMDFTYDPSTRTMTNSGPGGVTWNPISRRPF